MAGVDPAEVEQPAAPPPGPRAAAVRAGVPATPAAAPVAERPTAAPAHGRRHRALNATPAFRAAAVPAAALASGATRAAARQHAGAAPAPPVQAAAAAAARDTRSTRPRAIASAASRTASSSAGGVSRRHRRDVQHDDAAGPRINLVGDPEALVDVEPKRRLVAHGDFRTRPGISSGRDDVVQALANHRPNRRPTATKPAFHVLREGQSVLLSAGRRFCHRAVVSRRAPRAPCLKFAATVRKNRLMCRREYMGVAKRCVHSRVRQQ